MSVSKRNNKTQQEPERLLNAALYNPDIKPLLSTFRDDPRNRLGAAWKDLQRPGVQLFLQVLGRFLRALCQKVMSNVRNQTHSDKASSHTIRPPIIPPFPPCLRTPKHTQHRLTSIRFTDGPTFIMYMYRLRKFSRSPIDRRAK